MDALCVGAHCLLLLAGVRRAALADRDAGRRTADPQPLDVIRIRRQARRLAGRPAPSLMNV